MYVHTIYLYSQIIRLPINTQDTLANKIFNTYYKTRIINFIKIDIGTFIIVDVIDNYL